MGHRQQSNRLQSRLIVGGSKTLLKSYSQVRQNRQPVPLGTAKVSCVQPAISANQNAGAARNGTAAIEAHYSSLLSLPPVTCTRLPVINEPSWLASNT